jgi:hypothetical protein
MADNRNTKIQLRRGTAAQWFGQGKTLDIGEIGFEVDSGKFKIGTSGTNSWDALPYAGGSAISGSSGIAFLFNSSNNAYTLYSFITGIGQDGISFSTGDLSQYVPGATGSFYQISISNKLENFHDLTGSGFVVQSGTGNFFARSLTSGVNIELTNANGVFGNPMIGLRPGLTGITSISGINEFRIGSSSGIVLDAGDGVVSVNALTVNGATNLNGNINISLAAQIIATQAIIYSGNPTRFQGDVFFDNTPRVGPTGNGGINSTGVSLSGHKHVYTDITNFCSGVAECVDTQLVASTGLQITYSSSVPSLSVSLSGQALRLHNLSTDGFIVRSGDNILSRSITASGDNIVIGSGNGLLGNPQIGLNPSISITGLTVSSNATVGGNLIVNGNLVVEGDTVTQSVTSVQVEDPTIRLGQTSGTLSSSDVCDRGIEFVYRTGAGSTVPITGFMGYDYSEGRFTFLSSVGTTGGGSYSPCQYNDGTSGVLGVGGILSIGNLSGLQLILSESDNTKAPISVSSTGLVTNLNVGMLNGLSGFYYRNAANLTGILATGQLPVITNNGGGIGTVSTGNNTNSLANFVSNITVDQFGRVSGVTTGTGKVTIGTTDVSFGSTVTTFTGLSAVSAVVFSGSLSGLAASGDAVNIYNNNIANIGQAALVLVSGTGTGALRTFSDSSLYYDTINDRLGIRSLSGLLNVAFSGYGMTSVQAAVSLPTWSSTSISGLGTSPTYYLHNFIIDGGTP